MDADEAQELLLRHRRLLLTFATETQDETVRMTEDFDPASPVGQALAEIGNSCRQLIEMLESSGRITQTETTGND